MYCQQLIAKVSLGTQRHVQPGAVVSGKDTTRYSLLRLIAVCAVVLACSDATSTTSSSASTSSSSTRTFTRTGSHTMSSTTTGTTSRTVSRSHPSRSTSASLSRSMPTSQSAGFISLTRSSSPTYSHNSQTATGTSATVSATHSFTKQSGTFSTIPSPTRGTISTTVSLSSSPSNPSQSQTEGTSPTRTPTARPTMSQSLSYSGSRSAHTLAPWILAVDSTAPTSGTQVALMPDIVASFALAVQSDSSDGAAIERHLTILPNAVDPAGSPWAHQCRQGLPNLFNSPLSIPSGTTTTVEVELVYSLTSALLNTSSGHTFLICTSDGYFSGVVVHRMASSVLQVVADDGGTFPTDRTLVLPATGGQVAAWSILYTVTFSISDASALAALTGSGSPVYAVDDAVASSDGCTFGSRVATFNAVQANATALRVTLSSDALSVVPVAAKTLRLCFRGTSVLNVTLQLLHNLTLNGAPLHATQVVSLLGGAHAVVAPLTMAATTASNVLTIATLGLILTTTCVHTNNTGASLAPLTQTINSSQSFALTLSGASGYVDLCLALPSVPALDGRLTAARVFTPTSSALDNIAPQTASNRTAVALFVGSYADVAWTGSWNLSYATAAQQAAMLSHARVFIGALVGSTVSPVDGSLTTATPTGNATSWTIAVPSDWSALSGQADGAYVCWHTATATSTTSAMVALTQYSVTAVRIAHVGRNLNRPRTVALSGETNVVLQATQHNASTSMAFGAEASHLYVGAVVSNRCVSLSSAVIGVSAAVAATAVALSQGLVLHGSSGVVEGLFCVGRTNQSAYAATENRYTVAAFGALGNATHQLQLMHLPNGGVGASASDLADGTRSVTVSLSNIAANASDDMTQLVVLPCSTSDGSRIALTLHAAATFGGTARVSAVWASGANTLLASAQVALCWTAANASVTAVPPTDYYTNGAPLLPWGAALHTVPLVPTVVEHVLLGGAASQTFPLTFAAAWSLVYPMVVVFGAAASGTQCNTTAMRLLPTGGFATNASNTSISVTMGTSGLSALEPTAVLCMGVVNALTALASSVYYTLPFNVATLLMVRYNIMDETSTEMTMFPATTPTNAIAYLYQFTTTAVLVQVVLADTSLLTTSSGAGGLTLTLATSSVSSCASTNDVVASWNQGTNLSATVATSIASVASDTFFLCAKLTSAINALNGYAWTKLSLRTVGVATIDTTLSPLSYKSSAGVVGAPATALTAMSTLASAVRLLTVQGQHFDTTSDWVLRMYTLAGADCEATAPDLTATSSTTSSSALIFSVPAVSTPLVYHTVCARFTVQSTQVFVYLHLQLRILSFATVGVSASSISDRQLGIVAVANFAVNLTLYAPSGSAVVDISGIQLYASNASSCGRGSAIQEVFAALYALPLSIGADGGAVVSLSGLSSTGTYYLCYSTLATSARRWATMAASSAEPVGVTISTIDLKLSGYTLGSNNSIGSLVNSTLELKATGALLSTALVYVSVTDTACTAAALTGTTAFGNSRVPSLFTGCSGSASSVTLSAATQITGNSPMTVCLGFGSVLDASSLSSAPILTYVDSGLRLAVVQPDDLYIIQNQSAVVSYLGTLDRQPIVGMRDGTSNVALAIVPSSTVLRAEWIATSPVVQDTGEVYTFTSGDADSSFDFSTSSSQIQLRNGKFGFKYVLKFSVPSGASSYHAVNSSETELDSCQSSLQWAKWFTSTCTTCPDNAICDGSATFRVSGSYWRYSEYSPYLYSCSSPYMGDTCTSNTTVGTCTAGHTGPRCSVCLPGYGLASDQCTDCAGNEILHAFIVFLAAFVMVLVLVVLVISTLQCKKSDQFPIYFKLLINHLTAASTLGEFSQYLTSSLVTLFKIQRQASRPSPAFAALTCSLGLSWYQQFILVVSFPGFAAFALIAFFSVKQMVSECKMRYKLAHSNAFADSSKLDKSGDGGKSRRRQTALFFTRPNNNAKDGSAHGDDFLTMENVDRVNSIQVGEDDAPPRLEDALPAVSGGGNTPSVTRTTGVIRRRLNQRKPTQVSASFAPSQEGEDGTVKESQPSPAVEPLEEPTGAAHDFSDHPLEAPAAFDLDAPSGEAPPAQQAVRNGSTRSTSGVAVNFSIKDIRLAVSTQDEGGEPDVNGGEDENEDQDETEMEDAQDPNKLKRRMTVELGLMEVHGAVARAKMNHLFAVVMVIVMFAAYPSVLEWCANVLRCDEMDIGEAQIDGTIASNLQSYFFYDRSKLCTSSEHSRYVVAGITLGMLYGFGTPLCAVALYYRLKRAKSLGGVGYIDASRMFTFLIAGYRRDVWWWEAAVMFRKMVLIYIASFMQDAQQQTLCAFWTICAYLLAHVVVRPYEYETVDRMERYSLLVICLTLNFSLAFSWLDDRDTVAREFGYWSLSIFLFVINVGVVLWMLWEIVLEGTIKVQKFLFLNSALVHEKLHPRLAQCVMAFAYKPPEMVEILPDGQMIDVSQHDVAIPQDEQQAFIDAEDSGSDWSDDEEFQLEDDAVHQVTPTNDALRLPRSGEAAVDLQLSRAVTPEAAMQGGATPGAVANESSFVAFPATPGRGSLRNKLKSMGSIFGFRRGGQPQQQSAGSNMLGSVSPSEAGFVATAAAQEALAHLETAVAARSENVVSKLRAIIEGMQAHSEALITKYTTLKHTLSTKTTELEACKKRCDGKPNMEEEVRNHVQRLSELEEMAAELRDENESLKDQLQRLTTSYDRSSSPTNNQRLVETLRHEREDLIQRLARQEMEFGGGEHDGGHGGGSPLQLGASAQRGSPDMDQRLRDLALEAEAESVSAQALAEAEREAQLQMIEAQLKAKREARMRRVELGLPPTAPVARRKSHVNDLVDRITFGNDDDEETPPQPPNPFTSTMTPRGSVDAPSPRRSQSRFGNLAERLESAMRDAFQGRPGTRQGGIVPSRSGGGGSHVSFMTSGEGAPEVFNDQRYTAVEEPDSNRVLVIKRKHPKMRPPEFVAPWGHATWSKEEKKAGRRHA